MNSREMTRLKRRWDNRADAAWPQFLDWLEIQNIRGWQSQRVDFRFPIVAIVGENGSGKSTVLQAAASSYIDEDGNTYFPSDFFPETAWDRLHNVGIRAGYRQGVNRNEVFVRKPTERWRGPPERPRRHLRYLDLSRLQPVGTRTGYARIARSRHAERNATAFEQEQIDRMSSIMGRRYRDARMATTDFDPNREIPVLAKDGDPYSGFHQGSGETTIAELLQTDLPRNGLVLIDEVESSLHPRAQRRLLRDLSRVRTH
ncbi:hypothetical protein C2I36_02630 [Rhodobacteraceae bacterium WD3A24]|nr:hypothetical protein C2I36_02630 [Rhodobacteraceae bacterium WD3A24]